MSATGPTRHAGVGIAMVLSLWSSGAPLLAASKTALLDQLLHLDSEHRDLCRDMLTPEAVREKLSVAAEGLRRSLPSRLPGDRAADRADAPTRAEEIVRTLNRFVYGQLGLHASRDTHDACNLLLSGSLAGGQGYCVGMAAVYLALAENLDLPIHAVATPSHVFLRFDDGTVRINIETFEEGAASPDERYIIEQKISPRALRRGIFLRDLSPDEFLAQVYNNLGVVYSDRKEYVAAAAEYARALDLLPNFPAALYNHANDLLLQGEYRRAVSLFSRSLRLNPTDAWALRNRGIALCKLGNIEKAQLDLDAAQDLGPLQASRTEGGLKCPAGSQDAPSMGER